MSIGYITLYRFDDRKQDVSFPSSIRNDVVLFNWISDSLFGI